MSILNLLKNKINTGQPVNADELFSKISDYQVISFDIFDTLLKRNVHSPKDVFYYMEFSLGDKFLGFAENRIEAEKLARNKKPQDEVTLQDIYKEYPSISKNDQEFLINYELKIEADLLIVNKDMFPLFKKCLKTGKTVILISDMYLPKSFIETILKREGICGYKKLYLSSMINKTKSSGDLFKYVIQDLSINKNEIIHIGDSLNADYKSPRKLGISAVHIPTYTPKSKFHLDGLEINKNILNAFLDNTSPAKEEAYYKFGYEKFGMFLWGYAKWLYQSLSEEKIHDVYFFSLDGLIMKKAFDLLNKKEDICSHYLEVSRRSLRVPILWMNYELSHIIDMISPSKLIPIRTIFDGVGLDINKYKTLLYKYSFTLETVFDRKNVLQNKNLADMYKELAEDIERVSKEEYNLLVKYIEQNKLKGKFAIVDIGWSGGMQRYLDETLTKLGIPHQIKGYYIGVAEYYKRNVKAIPNLDLNGYLFDFMHDDTAYDKRSAFVGLFETLFLEQDGSVKNYSEVDGEVKANRMQYEYIENGKPTYEYLCVKKIQEGSLDFVKEISKNELLCNLTFSADDLFSGLRKSGLNPNYTDISMFADWRFFDEGETQYLAAPKGLIYYMIHLSEFKKDFLLSRWKIGYMKRLLKINLPYEKMYRFLIRYK